jgi:hypothetical protein
VEELYGVHTPQKTTAKFVQNTKKNYPKALESTLAGKLQLTLTVAWLTLDLQACRGFCRG